MVRVSRRVTRVNHGDELIDIVSRTGLIDNAGRHTLGKVRAS